MQEFEKQPIVPREVPYEQGIQTMVDLIEKSITVGEKPQGVPFLVALWGQPNSGKTYLSAEIYQPPINLQQYKKTATI